jgi:hypothetical protein
LTLFVGAVYIGFSISSRLAQTGDVVEGSTIRVWFEPVKEPEDFDARNKANQKANELVKPTLDQLDLIDPPFYALTENTCRRLTQLLAQLRGSKVARLESSRIDARLTATEAERAEWFAILPEADMDPAGSTPSGLIEVRADRVKGPQALRAYSEHLFVSDAFIRFVKEQRLSGLEFIWRPDKGKFAAAQWYAPIAAAFLGRGIDHPWFDPGTRGQYKEGNYLVVQPTDEKWRIGVNRFSGAQVRDGVKTSPPWLADLLTQLKVTQTRYGISIHMPPQVLRKFLPTSDFAYLRVAQPHDRRPYQGVQLCCTATARKKLLEARLAEKADFQPIIVLDTPPAGAEVFDRKDEPLPNTPNAEELHKLRQAEAKALAKYQANPKPPMPIKAPEIGKLIPPLKKLLKSQNATLAAGAAAAAVATAEKSLGLTIPKRWKELLSKVDGFEIDNCNALDGTAMLSVASAKELVRTHKGCRSMIQIGWPELPKTHLGVARNDLDDAIFLDTTKLTADGDCPVIFMDHEECRVVATWPAISIFLSEAIEKAE